MKYSIRIVYIVWAVLRGSTGWAQPSFHCTEPENFGGCSYIPNAAFSFNASGTSLNEFPNGLVTYWSCVSGSADLNWYNTSTGPEPSLPAALAGVNYAHMAYGNTSTPLEEGIVARIDRVSTGSEYIFSFFATRTYSGIDAPATFRVELIHCQDFERGCNNRLPLSIPAVKQTIFCEPQTSISNSGWQQFVVRFRADDNYNMIIIRPELNSKTMRTGAADWYVAYPELINPLNLAIETYNNEDCSVTVGISGCAVKNAYFRILDSMDNILDEGYALPSVTIPPNIARGVKITWSVPGAATAVGGCSESNPTVIKQFTIPPGLQIQHATATYVHGGPVVVTNPYTQPLAECTDNILCYSFRGGEYIDFDMSSSIPSGNIWQARITSLPYSLGNGFAASFNGIDVPSPYNGNYFNFSTNQYTRLRMVFTAGHVFDVEIRLINSTRNERRVLHVRNVVEAGTSQENFFCVPYSTAFAFPHKLIRGVDLPGFTYQWTFPAGMTVLTATNHAGIEFNDNQFNYTANPDPVATLAVSNIYGCGSYTIPLHIAANRCSQSARVTAPAVTVAAQTALETIKAGVHVYPNPAAGKVQIETGEAAREALFYAADGRQVKQVTITGNKTSVAINNLPQGTYWIKIILRNNQSVMKQLIKK